MQRAKMIPRYYLLNSLGLNSSSYGLKQREGERKRELMYENTQWTILSKGEHTFKQSLTCDVFHGFLYILKAK